MLEYRNMSELSLCFFFFFKPEMWKKCLECIDELLDILFEHNDIFIGENIAEDSESLIISDQVSCQFSVIFECVCPLTARSAVICSKLA